MTQPQKRFTIELRRTITRQVECSSREELERLMPKRYFEVGAWDNERQAEVVAWCEGCRKALFEEDECIVTSDDCTVCAECGKDLPIDGFIESGEEMDDFAGGGGA